ncbi:MAG TPA: 3-phosphoserine/phosphohydroxythreonine transaminase [Tepidisphaeraceae bacterium]|nr:3-phosphoserine/phosphohydroxythreonine transaminase [Tepidisphaeraceae bacterium]
MSHRIFNFSAGPAMLPTEALEKSAAALLDFQGKGFGIAEVSHRGKEFEGVLEEATVLCKKLLDVGESHDVVFLQGGATQLFTTIPMNFLSGTADYLVSGEWSKKAAGAAKDLGKVNVVASTEASNFDHSAPQSEWKLTDGADYFHVCTNETVHGHRLPTWPKHPNLIVDASSEFMSRPHPIGDCALVYGGAQKNLGPSGLVLAIVRKDLYPRQKKVPSKLWSFKDQAENKSMINTPPTFGVYILLEVFRWLDAKGGLTAMEQINEQKAKLIYDAVDNSNGFYTGTVTVKEQRSRMNVTYRLPSEELTDEFVKTAAKQGMVGLKGYRTVGGIRASIYNAMPVEGCQALASFMTDFAGKKG